MKEKVVIAAISGIFGMAISLLTTWQMMPIAANCKVLYVSQDEIMDLENKRVAKESLNERQLFFGQIEKAVKLATNIPSSYQNKTTKVVYSMNSVQGLNVRSISKEVHQRIIEELQKGITDEK